MNNIKVKNISSAKKELVCTFEEEIKKLDKTLINLINSRKLEIILADKLSDVININNTDIYTEYFPKDRDKVTRGLVSDNINAICIFANVVQKQNLGAILYHEIGHLIDYYKDWEMPQYSHTAFFINAYKQDIYNNWDAIQKDKTFRLIHYIQTSSLENISYPAVSEVFAQSFASIHNKLDDTDIIGKYFNNSFNAAKKLYSKFFEQEFN